MVFSNILTAQMVNDRKDTHHQKPTLPLKTSNSLDNFPDTSTNSINNHTGVTSPHFVSIFLVEHSTALEIK